MDSGLCCMGLWPQNNDGSFPEACATSNAGPTNPGAWTDVFPTASLVEHEWQTHGTCSGLTADVYLGDARQAFKSVAVPASVQGAANGSMMTPQAIVDAFQKANPSFPAGSIALSCGNNQLTAVEVCLTKGLKAETCQGVRSCRANVVKIAGK